MEKKEAEEEEEEEEEEVEEEEEESEVSKGRQAWTELACGLWAVAHG
jgi:hypothetical protein